MGEMTRVAVDAMGGDNAPAEIVKGAIAAVTENSRIKVNHSIRLHTLFPETEQRRLSSPAHAHKKYHINQLQ